MKATRKRTRRPGAGRKQSIAPNLPPLSTDESLSLANRVYMNLRVALMSGVLSPGESLTSRSLSLALGVSATPVRDALKRLEVEGALISRSKSAFFVRDPDQDEFAELLEVRLHLEGLAIQKAAAVCTPKHLHTIRALNDQYQRLMKRGGANVAKALVANFRFHFEMYSLSGSALLVQFIETNWVRIGPVLHRSTAPTHNLGKSMNAHQQMIDALANNDAKAAVEALRVDLMSAYSDIYPQLRPSARKDGSKITERLAAPLRALRPTS